MYLLQCSKSLIMFDQRANRFARCEMSEVWETKDGLRRVRRDPPTLDDAVLAVDELGTAPLGRCA